MFTGGKNAAVLDVELLNSYNGINATGTERHYVARVQGQPLNIGIWVDDTTDIGRSVPIRVRVQGEGQGQGQG